MAAPGSSSAFPLAAGQFSQQLTGRMAGWLTASCLAGPYSINHGAKPSSGPQFTLS